MSTYLYTYVRFDLNESLNAAILERIHYASVRDLGLDSNANANSLVTHLQAHLNNIQTCWLYSNALFYMEKQRNICLRIINVVNYIYNIYIFI